MQYREEREDIRDCVFDVCREEWPCTSQILARAAVGQTRRDGEGKKNAVPLVSLMDVDFPASEAGHRKRRLDRRTTSHVR